MRGADLGGLLAEQRGPQPQLTLPLQRDGLGVDAAGQHHVAEEAADLLTGELQWVVRVVEPLPLRGEQLHEIGHAS